LTNDGWDGTIRGDLSGIDLDALVTSQFPHTISGEANLHIERAHVVGGRVVEAEGTVTAGPGAIGRSLLVSGSQRLKLTAPGSVSKDAMSRFERLHFDFSLDSAGLRLVGRCPAGAMLVDASGRVLWSQPSEPSQPIVAFVQMLVPASQLHVPATMESEWLIRHLPVPRIVAPREAANAPSGHLKR
ncbi:MAG TPA: hypothetical protein VHV77_13030, partial [Pirellulales bacterium]|nr:hypothetical protein [Pirellulales bacterium]